MTAMDHLGNEYPSRSAMCRAYGISLDLFNHRKKYGWTLEAALTTPVGTVRRGKSATDDKGSAYSSIKEMCRAHNISETTYISRIRSGWTQERALSVPVDKELRGRAVRDHLGQEYPSITKMCEHYGISEALYSYRRKKGWSVEDALTRPVQERGKPITDHKGVEYPSASAMCKAYGISCSVFEGRMEKGWSMKDALTRPTPRGKGQR